MSVYLTIFAIFAIFGLRLPDRAARQLLPWIGLFLLWFMGTRYYVGCDFTGYMSRFNSIFSDTNSWNDVLQTEAGFQLLIISVKNAGLEYMWLNVFASAIFVICIIIFCRSHRRPLMILALLFPIIILQLGMSGIRQAIATAFLMLATVAFIKNKRFVTGLLILVGGLFHMSVIIFLPIALLPGRNISIKKMIISIILLAPLAYFILASRLDVYVGRYVDAEVSSGGAVVRYFLLLIPAIAFIRYHGRLENMFPEVYNLLKLFTIITFAIFPLVVFSTVALHRINYYVMPFSILTMVYVSLVLSPKRSTSVIRIMPALLYGGYCFSWLMTSKHAEICYIPYESYNFL